MTDRTHAASASMPRKRDIDARQVRVLLEPTRLRIAGLLNDGPATVKQLAAALDRTPSSISHHCDRLLDADLIQVVATRKVRAIEERFYARTAQTFLIGALAEDLSIEHSLLAGAAEDAAAHAVDPDIAPITGMQTFRLHRIPDDLAGELQRRLEDLALEFGSAEPGGTTRYGLVAGIFATDHPTVTGELE